MHCIKKSFTLVEILIVISLLILSSTFIGYGIIKGQTKYRFLKNVNLIADKIQFVQEMMFINNEDITLTLKPTEKGIKILIKSETPHKNYEWIPIISKNNEIEGVFLQQQVSLEFKSRGSNIPKETIAFNMNNHRLYIHLTGHPQKVKVYETSTMPVEIINQPPYPSL